MAKVVEIIVTLDLLFLRRFLVYKDPNVSFITHTHTHTNKIIIINFS